MLRDMKPRYFVIGMDPKTGKLAWTVTDDTGKLIEMGHHRLVKSDRVRMLQQVNECVTELVGRFAAVAPVHFGYEEPFFSPKTARAGIPLILAAGAAISAASVIENVTPRLVRIQEWKKAVCKNGNANKQLIAATIEQIWPLAYANAQRTDVIKPEKDDHIGIDGLVYDQDKLDSAGINRYVAMLVTRSARIQARNQTITLPLPASVRTVRKRPQWSTASTTSRRRGTQRRSSSAT